MADSIIQKKSFEFALEIIQLYQKLQEKREYILSKQVLQSGTISELMLKRLPLVRVAEIFYQRWRLLQKKPEKPDIGYDCCKSRALSMLMYRKNLHRSMSLFEFLPQSSKLRAKQNDQFTPPT